MILDLDDHPNVLEVKRVKDDPEVHSVAVNSEASYRDPAMKMDTGIRSFPEDLLEQIQMDPNWMIPRMQFRQAGDYAGCFTFRVKRIEAE